MFFRKKKIDYLCFFRKKKNNLRNISIGVAGTNTSRHFVQPDEKNNRR